MTKIPFRCARCGLRAEIDFDRHQAVRNVARNYQHKNRPGDLYPEGWQIVLVRSSDPFWRCASCVREIASGSPEWLGRQ